MNAPIRILTGASFDKRSGYVYVSIKGKRRAEHVIIKEQEIGRKLHPNERVHHKNGIRHDNRPKNLQLLTVKNHPPGQTIPDSRYHAAETIARYGMGQEIAEALKAKGIDPKMIQEIIAENLPSKSPGMQGSP